MNKYIKVTGASDRKWNRRMPKKRGLGEPKKNSLIKPWLFLWEVPFLSAAGSERKSSFGSGAK